MPWVPISVLPNIWVTEPIEHRPFALVPYNDPRVRDLASTHPSFQVFRSRFFDTFRQRIEPGILLRLDERGVHPEFRSAQATASFRDVLAASVVPRQRSLSLKYASRHRIWYADFFWLYPWMTDRHFEHVIARTPAMLALHDVREFRGQQSPDLNRMEASLDDFDQPMLRRLLERWSIRYSTKKPAWTDRALFRSLNMAFHAMSFPGGSVVTLHDAGRMIGLWISAFEILIHPGQGKVGWKDVITHLEHVDWEHRGCRARRRTVGTVSQPKKTNIAGWIYKKMYDCRNNFLHGNPITSESLRLPRSGRSLFDIAATPYRAALARHVGLVWDGPLPDPTDADAFGQYISDHADFAAPQREIELAILAILAAVRRPSRR